MYSIMGIEATAGYVYTHNSYIGHNGHTGYDTGSCRLCSTGSCRLCTAGYDGIHAHMLIQAMYSAGAIPVQDRHHMAMC